MQMLYYKSWTQNFTTFMGFLLRILSLKLLSIPCQKYRQRYFRHPTALPHNAKSDKTKCE